MIRDKRQCKFDKAPEPQLPDSNVVGDELFEQIPEEFEQTPLVHIFEAVTSILKDIRTDRRNPLSEPLFKTVKYNIGQMGRITHHKYNTEGAIGLPAAFVHFIDISYLVSTARIGEGTAKMRIKFVLNRLNNQDDEYQTEGISVFQRIKNAISDNIGLITKHALECRLTYFDPVENMDDGVQEYWITYELRFRDYTDYLYKRWKTTHVVIAPFTNHSDQNEDIRPKDHGDHDISFDDVSGFATKS